jgi:hypothetical protein
MCPAQYKQDHAKAQGVKRRVTKPIPSYFGATINRNSPLK